MNELQGHFSYARLLKYTFPTVIMMIFTSIYGVVDGLFLSNYTGKTAFAAVNFILPFLMVLGGMGFMFGNGGSALVAKTLGEGDKLKSNQIFSSLMIVSFSTGVFLSIAGYISLRPIAEGLGAEGQLLEDCLVYGRVYLLGIPASVIQNEFQNLYVTAGKPQLGLYATVASGVMNIVLDALFVAVFSWGLVGAAAATILSQWLCVVFVVIYFGRDNSSLLRFVKSKIDWRAMYKMCSNGFSELLNNVSMTIVSMIYNAQLLKYAGNDGLAAYGVLMYINFLFISIFIGYVVGVAPCISYHYGAQNNDEIKSLLRKSCVILTVCSLLMFSVSELMACPISKLFVGYDGGLYEMTLRGFLLFSFSYLFSGFAFFSSSFFTSLNNGRISAVISFMRTVVFQISLVLILPVFWGMDGIWLSVVIAELLASALGMFFVFIKRRAYHYG